MLAEAERSFRFWDRRLSLSLDGFNLLRCEAPTRLNNMVNWSSWYWYEALGGAAPVPDNERYGTVLERVRPVAVRVGLIAYF